MGHRWPHEGWSWWGELWNERQVIWGGGHFLASLLPDTWAFGCFQFHSEHSGKATVSQNHLCDIGRSYSDPEIQRYLRVACQSSLLNSALLQDPLGIPVSRALCWLLPCSCALLPPLLSSKNGNHIREWLMPLLRAEQGRDHGKHRNVLNDCVQLSTCPYPLGWKHTLHLSLQKGNGKKEICRRFPKVKITSNLQQA